MTNFFDLLKKLCATPGVAGFEDEVIILLQNELKPYVDKIEVDQLGNVIATKKGSNPKAPTIMIDAHIDEPSMLVKYIEESGFIRAERQGYPHNAALASQKILIHTRSGPIKGVFGVKGLHQLVFSETGSSAPPTVPNLRDLYIDVGCSSKNEVEKLGIRVGDPITYESEVELLGSGKCAVGKAFDNRALVAVLIETIQGEGGIRPTPLNFLKEIRKICNKSNDVVKCNDCDVVLTFHAKINQLICHHCNKFLL